jgi:hypothetical protein
MLTLDLSNLTRDQLQALLIILNDIPRVTPTFDELHTGMTGETTTVGAVTPPAAPGAVIAAWGLQ